MLVVQRLVSDDHDEHLGEAELSRFGHDVRLELILHRVHVSLIFNFNEVRLFDGHAKLATGSLESIEDVVRGVVVATATATVLVDHDPLLMAKVNDILDREVA